MAVAQDDLDRQAHLVLNRFGLGAKPGSIERIRTDPKAALLDELDTPRIARIKFPYLKTYEEVCQAVHRGFEIEEPIKERELTARLAKHLEPEIGFVERLVLFFSNHFSMHIYKDSAILVTIGQLERDTIRTHVLGSFADMLVGVIKHPAMVRYLDNHTSMGPHSPVGRSWGAGLNHNLAREILELHTLGVGGGYTEDDIHNLAKAISGWSFVSGWEAENRANGGTPQNRGQFIFHSGWHEPGVRNILGKSYSATGTGQGEAVLRDLALHPSTAQFLAFKLVHHFITDEPTPAMVQPLARVFMKSGGNLKAVARALVNLPEAWSLPLRKLRRPYELQVAEMRALQRNYDPKNRWPFNETLRALRNGPWEHGQPDGYSDETAYWMGPDAMRLRLETAQLNSWSLSKLGPIGSGVVQLADSLFAGALSRQSRRAIVQAPDRWHAIALLFMIPEFQRR